MKDEVLKVRLQGSPEILKIRLQGLPSTIKWFLKVLEKDTRFDMVDTSSMYQIKTSNKYKRCYTNIIRKQTSTVSKK
ncbi:MAG: hypothetical protein K6G62_02670 [Eubacterium sp.]|nr:hypothetical protein [Eubacterium sp.]